MSTNHESAASQPHPSSRPRRATAVRTTLLALLGLVVGIVAGVLAFDRGPGVELLALLTAAGGLVAGGLAGVAAGRRAGGSGP